MPPRIGPEEWFLGCTFALPAVFEKSFLEERGDIRERLDMVLSFRGGSRVWGVWSSASRVTNGAY